MNTELGAVRGKHNSDNQASQARHKIWHPPEAVFVQLEMSKSSTGAGLEWPNKILWEMTGTENESGSGWKLSVS